MSYPSKLEYLKTIFRRYNERNKLKKPQILNEYCKICGMTSKHAIRLSTKRPHERRQHFGPKVKCAPKILVSPLWYIWQSMNQSNSKKIKSGLSEWLSYASSCDQSHLFTDEVPALLLKNSCANIERLLKKLDELSLKEKLQSRQKTGR